MKKAIKLSIAAALVSSTMAQAADVTIDGVRGGNLDLQLKAMTVIDDEKNGYAPSNGSGYLVKLKYETPEVFTDGLKVGVGMYVNGDAGLTNWDVKKKPAAGGDWDKGAYGMVVDRDGKTKSLMGEAYLDYTNDYFHARIGRQTIDTPLTVIQTSLMPNFYEAYMLDTDIIDGLKVTAGHMAQMSFGSRAMADWGMIGERTGTAGVATRLYNDPKNDPFYSGADAALVEQAEFYSMSEAAGFSDSDGRSVLGLTYTGIKNLQADFWAYHAYDIANDFYTELKYKIPVAKGMAVNLSAQYLMQKDTGDSLAGDIDFNMMGAKAALGTKKWGVFAAFNSSGSKDNGTEGQYFNAWGADPAYTSSIFSRNAYREDVDAYKIGAHYVIMKGLKLMVNYADYGKSKTEQSSRDLSPTNVAAGNDAYEIDTVLVYKPSKEWMFKVFNARRVSEYNSTTGASTDGARQNHYRLIASYTF
ncbi:MAG: OprD family porin [Sulfurimonas sp.]|uniref:OprD family outer membrane porin n=1 Tax=Sulfurimonas sp. TaxID=2022749 RepID=UPI00262900C0|nr:OprD family outer membrane porin [Sulfurimonas sp.]MCW8894926.1 OprD family porin [Sulfurimonas sp.]MCW8954396.1 OprD family porin [Sulfurimonas sp.]MCW9068206.1 OprD family porin [Sulfurimonas sp.]